MEFLEKNEYSRPLFLPVMDFAYSIIQYHNHEKIFFGNPRNKQLDGQQPSNPHHSGGFNGYDFHHLTQGHGLGHDFSHVPLLSNPFLILSIKQSPINNHPHAFF